MHDWHVGQEIVCVKPFENTCRCSDCKAVILPQMGCKYTIRAILEGTNADLRESGSKLGFLLEEIVNSDNHPAFQGEIGWCSTAFRPLTKRKTDISVFTDILNKVKIGEDA